MTDGELIYETAIKAWLTDRATGKDPESEHWAPRGYLIRAIDAALAAAAAIAPPAPGMK
jgi:hypothetical protein